jgi:hypothetical protein
MGRFGAKAFGVEKTPLSVQDSVSGQLKVLESATAETSGKFLSYNGSEIPW